MMRETKKAIGSIGSWFATVDGEQLPVVRPGELQFNEFVAQIRQKGRVVLQKDEEPVKNAQGKQF